MTANTTTTTATNVVMPREFTPKRGIKAITMTIVDLSKNDKAHHQKSLILELLGERKDKSMTLADMIGIVEGDDKLKARLQSKQSVFNCITYHMKDLAKKGVISTKE